MELIDRFNTDLWMTSHIEKHTDFMNYSIVKGQCLKPGLFQFAIREIQEDETKDCKMAMVKLEGSCGKMDPLNSVRNCQLLVKDEQVVGVLIEDECVVRKDLKQ